MKKDKSCNLSHIRKEKGMTQETLAELSGVTVRTIQRIEAGDVVPQHHTVKLLAEALNIEPKEIIFGTAVNELPENTAKTDLLPLYHLLPLLGIIFPFTNIILPLILWVVKRHAHPRYDIDGKKSINFQLTITLIAALTIPLLILYMPVGYPLFLLTYGLGIFMCIWNTVKVVKNQTPKYPFAIPFIKIPANVG